MADDGLAAKNELLNRKLLREQRAREEAELLLEQKSAELYVAYERSRTLAQAMDAAVDGIAIMGASGTFLYLNGAYASLFGYTIDELIDKPWSVLFELGALRFMQRQVMPELASTGFWQGDVEGLHKDGFTVFQNISLTTLQGGRIIFSTRDISRRIMREQTINQLELRLQEAEKSAMMSIVKDALAHDLNNIFAAISGYAYLLTAAADVQTEIHRFAEQISKATDQAINVVESLGSSVDEQVAQLKTVCLDDFINTNIQLANGFRPAGVNVEFVTDRVPKSSLSTNDILLSRCLLNILKNAFEAMSDRGQVKIELLQPTDKPLLSYEHCRLLGNQGTDCTCMVQIIDDGSGMDEQALNTLLTPMFTTKSGKRLRGLGMQSLRSFVDQRLGYVEVLSDQSHGSCFRLYLADKSSAKQVSD